VTAPDPVSESERAEDRRALKGIVFWLVGCSIAAVLFLLFAIYLDWV